MSTMGKRDQAFLLSEAPGTLSRKNVTVKTASERVLAGGTLMGRVLAAAVAAAAENTGDADISGVTVTFGREVQEGVYTLTCTAADTNAGTFSVEAPDGSALSALTVAAAYSSDHIKLTLPDGTTDWAEGDVVTVTVSAKHAPYAADGSDGTQWVDGILLNGVDASSADRGAVLIHQLAEVKASELTGADVAAVEQLAQKFIAVRS